jgi:hypothetical protein
MKSISKETQAMLNSLKKAVNKTLEKKKRLGQYAVVWDGKKPVIRDYSFSQARVDNRE